ncbi:hypothetical protein AB0940_18155 [Streptomyces sp. NPDC006656]|uniref:hypothetical protein n=1 Tax=Streptomyces sp. NPDC006656 TaxID=3156899 RepID=UPI00345544D1
MDGEVDADGLVGAGEVDADGAGPVVVESGEDVEVGGGGGQRVLPEGVAGEIGDQVVVTVIASDLDCFGHDGADEGRDVHIGVPQARSVLGVDPYAGAAVRSRRPHACARIAAGCG